MTHVSTSISLVNRVWQSLEAFLNNQAPGSSVPDVRYSIICDLGDNMKASSERNYPRLGFRR